MDIMDSTYSLKVNKAKVGIDMDEGMDSSEDSIIDYYEMESNHVVWMLGCKKYPY